MAYELPEWVAELTDPRRARTTEELADRLVPLAEQAIDISRRLQAQLTELNAPFETEALQALVDVLHTRSAQAFGEVNGEIENTGQDRVARILKRADAAPAGQRAELRERLAAEVFPALKAQQRVVCERIGDRTADAVQAAAKTLLDRTGELAAAVTDMVHQVLPAAQEGLTLAGRVSALTGRVRKAGRGDIPGDLRREAAEVAGSCEETLGRLEMEWSMIGARASTVRAALRAVEETAFSEVTQAMAHCVAELAPAHVKVLNDTEDLAIALLTEGS
ncbi:hypothetical protein [Actinocorallia longicatena]|uniref:Uncharacterized protein n=1 Tax=Actinocorallia longicatena TaxID=111803 RepID=A0ABP6Q085_9ACTN